jgi:hypothetical protein
MKTNSFFSEKAHAPVISYTSLFRHKWLILSLFLLSAGCKKVTEETGLVGVCPIVISTDPANLATEVALDKTISAVFNEAMDPQTINETSFTVKNGAITVPGNVTFAGTTASFSPRAGLVRNTTYTVTIHKGVKDPAGNAMVEDHIWTFKSITDTTAPRVISTDPANAATAVVLNKIITATFSEVMDPSTINLLTFLVKQGTTTVLGSVTYSGTTAVFTPSNSLLINTVYTATITTGAKDLAGISIVGDYIWTFTTVAPIVPPPIPPSILGTASIFGAFGGNAGVTNQGINTVINNGSIGTTAASTLITGFHDQDFSYTETGSNIGNVTGKIYTAPPAPGDLASFEFATNALIDANAAYLSISPAAKPGGTDPGAGELGGLTLPPGIYKSASGTFKITTGNLTLDAQGDPNAQWIFQTAAGLTVGIAGPAGARSVVLINGATAGNVYWYVGSAATINGAGGGIMTGTIIASDGVTFSTAGNAVQTVLNGRAISLVASVTMVNTTVNVPN